MDGMKVGKIDARKLSSTEQEKLRQKAMEMRLQGYLHEDIANTLGIHIGTVQAWWRHYKQLGTITLKNKVRGRTKSNSSAHSNDVENGQL